MIEAFLAFIAIAHATAALRAFASIGARMHAAGTISLTRPAGTSSSLSRTSITGSSCPVRPSKRVAHSPGGQEGMAITTRSGWTWRTALRASARSGGEVMTSPPHCRVISETDPDICGSATTSVILGHSSDIRGNPDLSGRGRRGCRKSYPA